MKLWKNAILITLSATTTLADKGSMWLATTHSNTNSVQNTQQSIQPLRHEDLKKRKARYVQPASKDIPKEKETLNDMRLRGLDERDIFAFLEHNAIQKGIYTIPTNLDEWMEQYGGTLINDSSYNLTDSWEYDYSSPLKALRSYWHAYYLLDRDQILQHSDPSFITYLEKYKKRTLMKDPPKYGNDGLSVISPLLQGKCSIENREYTLVFYRRESPTNPRKNRISFHWDFYVFLNNQYYYSHAPEISYFARLYKIMGTTGIYPAGQYEFLTDKLRNTAVPPKFYTIQNTDITTEPEP